MEWLGNILNMSSSAITNWLVICSAIMVIFTIVWFWHWGDLSLGYSILSGIVVLMLVFSWFTGAIPCWISDYECTITPNAINYESKEELQEWLNNCIKEMKENEGKFAGAYCSGGSSGFADFNYYAKKESRRSK